MPILHKFASGLSFALLLTLLGASSLCAQTPPELGGKLIDAGPTASTPSYSGSTEGSVRRSPEDYDPLLDPPPLPHSSVTLIGGTVTEVDEIQNRITVRPFAGKQRLHLNFDIRTHIFRDGEVATERDLRTGERVYLDTMLNGSKIFAKSIWIRNKEENGNGQGQILRYDSRANTLTLRDEVSAEPASFRLDSATVIHNGGKTGSVDDLKPGSLVAVAFDPAQSRSGVVREISLLAQPGSVFTFLGKITFIDLSQKLIALTNQSDGKNYDVYFEAIPPAVLQGLREGSLASISAVFDGSRYVAQNVDLAGGGQGVTEQK